MKRKKIFILIVMCMVLILSACGSKKTPQTMAGVKDYLVGRGLYNEDNAYSNSRITGDTLAMILTNGWSVSFGEYKTVADCVSEYSMGQLILDDPVETTESNYSIIEGNQGDDYKIIVRVDDTLLVIAGPGDAKEDLRELAKDLGYY